MAYFLSEIANTVILTIKGSMDAEEVLLLRPELEKIIGMKETNLTIDMNNVTFLDSAGIGAIVHAFKKLRSNGCVLKLCGLRGQPMDLVRTLRIDKAIPVDSTDGQAA